MNYKRAVAGGRTAGRSLSALPSGNDVIGHRLLCRRRLYASENGAAVAGNRTDSTSTQSSELRVYAKVCATTGLFSVIECPENETQCTVLCSCEYPITDIENRKRQ